MLLWVDNVSLIYISLVQPIDFLRTFNTYEMNNNIFINFMII